LTVNARGVVGQTTFSPLAACHACIAQLSPQPEGLVQRGIRGSAHDPFGYVLAHHGPMLEAVSRSSADDPHVVVFWMAIDKEMAISGVLILTHTRFHNRLAFHSRKSE
jgi:hypothetical protein